MGEAVGFWEISVPSFQFYYEPKSALKNEDLKKGGAKDQGLLWVSEMLAQLWWVQG